MLANQLRSVRVREELLQEVLGILLWVNKASIPWHEPQELIFVSLALLLQVVIVWAVSLVAFTLLLVANLRLIIIWMKLKLLPSMTGTASVFECAAIVVLFHVFAGLPPSALLHGIVVDMGRPPEVLPIVSIETLVTLVIFVRKWTPDRLEVEHIKVDVALHLLQDGD